MRIKYQHIHNINKEIEFIKKGPNSYSEAENYDI